jgi:hypothetical protein
VEHFLEHSLELDQLGVEVGGIEKRVKLDSALSINDQIRCDGDLITRKIG